MTVTPATLAQRGALAIAKPSHLEAPGLQLASTMAAVDGEGRLLLFQASDASSNSKVAELPLDKASLSVEGGVVEVRGGSIRRLRFELDQDSTFFRLLTGAAPLEGWHTLGLVDAVVLTLNPNDPRQPPRGRRLGQGRLTTLMLGHRDGSLRLDNPHEVLEIPAQEARGVEAVARDPLAAVIRLVRPGAEPAEPLVGVRLRPVPPGVLEDRTEVPARLVAATVTGRVGARAVRGAFLVRSSDGLEVLDHEGVTLGHMELAELGWSAYRSALLFRGGSLTASADLPEELARWLLADLPESPAPLLDCVIGGERLGAGEVWVLGDSLCVHTVTPRVLDLSRLVANDLALESGPLGYRLRVGSDLVLEGPRSTLTEIRRAVAGPLGRARLESQSLAHIYGLYHRLRTERWLGLALGPIVLTERLLQEASALPPEQDEDPERLERRRIVAETLIVAEQLRSVRLHLGTATVALPFGLLDEEGAWLDDLVGEAEGAIWLDKARRRVLGVLRTQVRQVSMDVAFALADAERAVSRMEPVHHPPDEANVTSMLGRTGLDAATMLISPVSATLTIASTEAGKVTDRVSEDVRSRELVDRWGPLCRSSWRLLVDVTAASAVETHGALSRLWADLAARDQALIDAGTAKPKRLLEVLLDRIQALRQQRLEPIAIDGETEADLAAFLAERMDQGPRELVRSLGGLSS